MNQHSDIDRVLQVWMADGPTAIPDRVVDVVAARIGVQQQRRVWPFPRRTTSMTPIKLIAGLAAAVVVAVVGWQLLPGTSGPGGAPTAAPSPTAAPTLTSDATPRTRTYRPFASSRDLTMTFDLPAGWSEFQDWAVIGPAGGTDPAGVSVVFFEAGGIFSDPCRWDSAGTGAEGQPGDLAVGGDALELATALHTNSAYTSAGPPTPVSLGSHAGYAVEIQLPTDLDFVATCDVVSGDQDGAYVVFGGEDGGFYPQGPGNRWQVSVVDVGDVQLIVVLSSFAGTSAADMAAARSIIEGIEIGS